VVLTDALSCVVLIVGAALICILGLDRPAAGRACKRRSVAWTGRNIISTWCCLRIIQLFPGRVLLGLGFVLGPSYWIGNQAIVQRTLGAGSQNQARASYVFCAVLKLVFPVLLVLPGLIAWPCFMTGSAIRASGAIAWPIESCRCWW